MSAFTDWWKVASLINVGDINAAEDAFDLAYNAGMERAIKIAEGLYNHSEGDDRFIYDEDVGGEIRGDMGGQYKDSERD